MFKTPSPPPPPPPPPTPPVFGSQQTRSAGERLSQSAIGALGGTITTSGLGDVTTAKTTRRTLIGD